MSEGQQQWWGFKAQNFDSVLLFKCGKFYEVGRSTVGDAWMQIIVRDAWMNTICMNACMHSFVLNPVLLYMCGKMGAHWGMLGGVGQIHGCLHLYIRPSLGLPFKVWQLGERACLLQGYACHKPHVRWSVQLLHMYIDTLKTYCRYCRDYCWGDVCASSTQASAPCCLL